MSVPVTTVAWARSLQPPAYTTVPPRTTLQPAPAPIESKPQAKKMQWPPAIRDYVQRAFDERNAIPGISSAEMQDKLKATISYYAERNAHEGIDWPSYPLPQQLLKQEQEREALANINNNSVDPDSPLTKKRKAQDPSHVERGQAASPPWRKTNLESRITYAEGHNDKRQKKASLVPESSKYNQADLEKRRQRFQPPVSPKTSSSRKDEDAVDHAPVVGTNMNLEKAYFRLTAPPKPETVRPLAVLEKTLKLLLEKWKEQKNYNYICNQFKSLRQDLTVQHIKNAFTVKVYETHARISLELGDLGEYNQCQTQLKALYAQNLGGKPAEFKAYRILYFVYTCNKTDMNDMLAELTPADKSQVWIKHALDVRSALALGNYHKFFRLYLQAKNMGAYLMDMFIERERLNALANMSKGYQIVKLRFITDELGFDNDEACRDFLESHGAKDLIEERTDETYGIHLRVMLRQYASHVEQLRAAAFAKVDIKGQI